jgi:hypothetical protein
VAWRRPAAVAVGSPFGSPLLSAPPAFERRENQYRLRAFDGAAFRVLSLVVPASVPFRNNPVTGGVLLTGAAGEVPAGWTSGQGRRSRLRGSWRS